MSAALARVAIRGTMWSYVAQYGAKLIAFASTLVLARLLLQEDFGVTGYAVAVVGLLEVLGGLGLGPAVIFRRADERDTSTAFWLALLTGVALFGLTWIGAPLAGWFFSDPRAVEVTRALAIILPIAALTEIHEAVLQTRLDFRRIVVPDLLRAVTKASVAITLAVLGFDYWSLIFGQIAGFCVSLAAYWRVSPWQPHAIFELGSVRRLLRYGLQIVALNGWDTLVRNLNLFVIGRFLGASALGVYTLALRIPELLIEQLSCGISRVVFPLFTSLKEDPGSLSRAFLQTARYVTLIAFPLGFGLAIVAHPFVLVFLGERWLDAVPVLQVMCASFVLRAISFHAGDVYKAQGRPTWITLMSMTQTALFLPLLIWIATTTQSLLHVVIVHLFATFFLASLEMAFAVRLLGNRLAEVLRAYQPATTATIPLLAMTQLTLQATSTFAPVLQLLLAVTAGALAYAAALLLLERPLVFEVRRHLGTALSSGSGS